MAKNTFNLSNNVAPDLCMAAMTFHTWIRGQKGCYGASFKQDLNTECRVRADFESGWIELSIDWSPRQLEKDHQIFISAESDEGYLAIPYSLSDFLNKYNFIDLDKLTETLEKVAKDQLLNKDGSDIKKNSLIQEKGARQ